MMVSIIYDIGGIFVVLIVLTVLPGPSKVILFFVAFVSHISHQSLTYGLRFIQLRSDRDGRGNNTSFFTLC